jgi:hypothetical protein
MQGQTEFQRSITGVEKFRLFTHGHLLSPCVRIVVTLLI